MRTFERSTPQLSRGDIWASSRQFSCRGRCLNHRSGQTSCSIQRELPPCLRPQHFPSTQRAGMSASTCATPPSTRSRCPPMPRLHAQCPAFFWEEQQQWYFAGYDQVNGLLRDRRFGRQILHVATREELGLPEPKPHLDDFDRLERYSLLELEPPAHTRLRTLVNRAFVSRQIEQLRPEIAALAHSIIDGFEKDGEVELLKTYAEIIPVTVIARMLGVPVDMAPTAARLVAPHGAHVHVQSDARDRARRQPGVRRVQRLSEEHHRLEARQSGR